VSVLGVLNLTGSLDLVNNDLIVQTGDLQALTAAFKAKKLCSPAVGAYTPLGILAQLRALVAANSRRTTSAFSASERGSVAIMVRAAAKPPSPSLGGLALRVLALGVQSGVQSGWAPPVSPLPAAVVADGAQTGGLKVEGSNPSTPIE